MNQKEILETLKIIRNNSKKRKFNQSIDLIINLKDIDLKKDKVESYVALSHSPKPKKLAVIVSANSKEAVKPYFDVVITKEDFPKYKDKKELNKLVNTMDLFVAQADLMGEVAVVFGKALGPKGKMPNPKAGCVIPINPPKQLLVPLSNKLHKTVRVEAKGGNMIKLLIGKENMKDEDIVSNIIMVYENLIHVLPQGKNNIKNVGIKLTMGPTAKVGEKPEENKPEEKGKQNDKKSN